MITVLLHNTDHVCSQWAAIISRDFTYVVLLQQIHFALVSITWSFVLACYGSCRFSLCAVCWRGMSYSHHTRLHYQPIIPGSPYKPSYKAHIYQAPLSQEPSHQTPLPGIILGSSIPAIIYQDPLHHTFIPSYLILKSIAVDKIITDNPISYLGVLWCELNILVNNEVTWSCNVNLQLTMQFILRWPLYKHAVNVHLKKHDNHLVHSYPCSEKVVPPLVNHISHYCNSDD